MNHLKLPSTVVFGLLPILGLAGCIPVVLPQNTVVTPVVEKKDDQPRDLRTFFESMKLPDFAQSTPEDVAQRVTVKDTKFDARIGFSGPQTAAAGNSNVEYATYFLRGWQNRKTGKREHQLYIDISYDNREWRFYDSVSLEGGAPGRFVGIDRHFYRCHRDYEYSTDWIAECQYDETFGVDLPEVFLRKYAASGFSIRANAHDSTKTLITVPSTYIKGYLLAVPSAKGKEPPNHRASVDARTKESR